MDSVCSHFEKHTPENSNKNNSFANTLNDSDSSLLTHNGLFISLRHHVFNFKLVSVGLIQHLSV